MILETNSDTVYLVSSVV